MSDFEKILVANRGEIALRVMRSAHALGYGTVAVFSDADRNSPHVLCADEAVHIGASQVGASYLNIDAIIDAAKTSGADAVHPGYGFLSENAEFARRCAASGLNFIGPSAEAIELMGCKRRAKIAMLEAGVPCVPGYQGAEQDNERLQTEAETIGFPVMIKASAGGGGRGMRRVDSAAQMGAALRSARSEAGNAFGSEELILEKAIVEPRHVEIQVMADRHGNCVYLGERDCSVQRRHQKVVEEAPSPFVDESLRQRMGEAAVAAAQSCGYQGAGTVEFLVDKERQFYFLEMNTRLQVEHPVTECITGLDLVEWQLRVARGEALGFDQSDIQLQGHAIEVRLYAEDCRQNFLPQSGPIKLWQPCTDSGARIDAGIDGAQDVSPFYDPMLAKIICHGATREDARRQLQRCLQKSVLLGVNHNLGFLANILGHPVFTAGGATTAFIEDDFAADTSMQTAQYSNEDIALAATLFYVHGHFAGRLVDSLAKIGFAPVKMKVDDTLYQLSVEARQERSGELALSVRTDSETIEISLRYAGENQCRYRIGGLNKSVAFHCEDENLYLDSSQGNVCFTDVTHQPVEQSDSEGSGVIKAPMDGVIVEVMAKSGDQVKRGDTLLVLEAMKMEHSLKADVDGVVAEIAVEKGQQVKIRQVLAMLVNKD